MTNPAPNTFLVKSGLFDRERKLITTPDSIAFETSDRYAEPLLTFYFHDVIDIAFNHEPIYWYRYDVGTRYQVLLKNKSDETLRIQFTNYFGTRRIYESYFQEIMNFLWEHCMRNIVDQHLTDIYEHRNATLGRTRINQQGIFVDGTGLSFEWSDLDFREYKRHIVLSRKSAREFHLHVYFGEWHSEVLFSVIKTILKYPGRFLVSSTLENKSGNLVH